MEEDQHRESVVCAQHKREPTVFKGDTSGDATESIELGYMFNGTTNAILGGSATASYVVTVILNDASLGGGTESENYT